jgi:hypothetical protein
LLPKSRIDRQRRPDSVVSVSQYERESCATQLVLDTSQLLDAIYYLTAGFLPGEWACLKVDLEIDSYYRTITAASNVIPKGLIAHEALGMPIVQLSGCAL